MSASVIFFGIYLGAIAFWGGWFIAFATRDWRHRRRAIIDAPASPTLRFCRDCRWASPQPSGFFGTPDYTHAWCMHPTSLLSTGNFLASGQYSPDNAQYCSVMRTRISISGGDACGETGMHWQLREKHTPRLGAPS
jgi:hypothetical protein